MMSDEYDVIVVGGGPAGASAATRLAAGGATVLLLEEKRMPREKLCGEFITPECFPTLERLCVMERLMGGGAHILNRLRLCVSDHRVVEAPVREVSPGFEWAMSLSRARFDEILLRRAREAGANCLEGFAVKQCVQQHQSGRPIGVETTSLRDGRPLVFRAPIIIDASGRNSRLMVKPNERVAGRRGKRLFAMKAHLEGVEGLFDQVELYFFPGGYGGLSRIEEGLVNLCFIVNERILKRAGGRPEVVLSETIMRNSLARERLAKAKAAGSWLAAGPLRFGSRRQSLNGIIAIGDAAGMIDPFTGTGLQIALRSGEIAAEAILDSTRRDPSVGLIEAYRKRYQTEFSRRMAVAGLLRRAAFSPPSATLVAGVLGMAPTLAKTLLRSTRIQTVTP